METVLESAVRGTREHHDLNLRAFSCLMESSVGYAAKLCFWQLWLRCGGEPGIIRRITGRELSYGRGNVNRHLAELDAAGFIDVFRYQAGKRDTDLERPGDMRILVFFPAVDHPPTVAEKQARRRNLDQRLFPFMEEESDEVVEKSRHCQKRPTQGCAKKAHPKGRRKKPTLAHKISKRKFDSLQFETVVGLPFDATIDQCRSSVVADMNMEFSGDVVRRRRTIKKLNPQAENQGCAKKAHPC